MQNDNNPSNGISGERDLTVRLLPDLPTKHDAFGPHELLANAIAELIETEDGGKAIALEGGWGSGKSSVVEMLKDRLEGDQTESATTCVHVFDAWSHEGDPLRRVFLEDLTSFCTSRFDSATKDYWDGRRKSEITGRTRETAQQTIPVLRSSWPLLSLTLLTLFPIAVAIVSGLVRQELHDRIIPLSVTDAEYR